MDRQGFMSSHRSPHFNPSARERSVSPPNLSVQGYNTPSHVTSKYSNPLPFNTLTNHGVLPETVRQLSDMKAYLSRHVSCTYL